MSGHTAYRRGLAAEDCVAREVEAAGGTVLARRFRGGGGEIDLICRLRDVILFIEVKTGRSFDAALARVTPQQIGRIARASEAWLAKTGRALDTMRRLDIALVDASGALRVIRNVTA